MSRYPDLPAAAQRAEEEVETVARVHHDIGADFGVGRTESRFRFAQSGQSAHTEFVFAAQLGRLGGRRLFRHPVAGRIGRLPLSRIAPLAAHQVHAAARLRRSDDLRTGHRRLSDGITRKSHFYQVRNDIILCVIALNESRVEN